MYSVIRVALAALLVVAATVSATWGGRARADDLLPLSAYGSLPSLELVELSPSGDRVAFITVAGEQRRLAVVDVVKERSLGGVIVGEAKVRNLQWVGDERVLVTTSSTETFPSLGIRKRELYIGQIYDTTDRQVVAILRNTTGVFPALMGPTDVVATGNGPAVLVRAYSFDEPGRLSLYRVDTATGRARVAESMPGDVDDYILDASGRTVARSTYDDREKVWSLRLRRGDAYRQVWSTPAPLDPPELMGLGLEGDSIIVSADRPDLIPEGRDDSAFFNVDLATGEWKPLRFEFHPAAVLFHPVNRTLIGAARLGEEGMRYSFPDPDAARMWSAAEELFPGQAPQLISWSDSLRQAIVFTSGNGESGAYHLLDLEQESVIPVGAAYAAVPPAKVGAIRALSYDAADGLEIHGYLTLPPGVSEARGLPLVVLAHGGPASRDIMGFDWWAQALASRGYAVLQPNFRGSTGYGQAFMEAGYGEWGRKMQTDLSDGVRHLAAEGVIDPARVCIVGASYGGYAALAGPTLDRGVYRCAVSVAGVSDLRAMVNYEASRGQRRDNETVRYWNRFMGAERLGDRSLDERSPARLADRVDAPILLLHGRDDTVVPIEQSRMMATALRRVGKPVEFIELAGEDHWLSRGDTRQQMLVETVKFLQTHNPAD